MKKIIIVSSLALLIFASKAQTISMSPGSWEVDANGAVFEMFEGVPSMYIHQGFARPKVPVDFKTGVIEYEVWVTDRRGFPGVRFRVVDDSNWEEFYIRPHQSGNPDANQYTPVYNGIAGWQVYYGKPYAVAYTYKMNAWNHVKLVIAENELEVFINDMNKPVTYIPQLERTPVKGGIQLYAGGPSGFRFANFKYAAQSNVNLKSERAEVTKPAAEIIPSWEVSESFELGEFFDESYGFDFKRADKLAWKRIGVKNKGHVNISQWAVQTDRKKSSVAKVIIESEREQTKRLSYGFSDEVIVFLNGEIIHGGKDGFRSRDYRFLGTIGYFDDLYLDLKKGKNELWMVVTEGIGGWVVQGKFDDLKGISIVND